MKAELERAGTENDFLSVKPEAITDEQLQEMGKTAEIEREELLQKHPELQALQGRIDRLMENAGNFENRMAILGMMMEANLKEIHNQLIILSKRAEDWKEAVCGLSRPDLP